jgi:hypothetical protein
MRNFAPRLLTLLAAAAGTMLTQCQAVPSPTPTPSATPTPSPSPRYAEERWGVVVLYAERTGCRQFAGPPRIGAYRGDKITWRIYNNCRKEATVEIGDIRQSPPDDAGFAGAKSWKDIEDWKERRKKHDPADPFEAGDKKKKVAAGAIEDLTLKVKANLECEPDAKHPGECALYTYVAFLDGKPDEGDIVIWP